MKLLWLSLPGLLLFVPVAEACPITYSSFSSYVPYVPPRVIVRTRVVVKKVEVPVAVPVAVYAPLAVSVPSYYASYAPPAITPAPAAAPSYAPPAAPVPVPAPAPAYSPPPAPAPASAPAYVPTPPPAAPAYAPAPAAAPAPSYSPPPPAAAPGYGSSPGASAAPGGELKVVLDALQKMNTRLDAMEARLGGDNPVPAEKAPARLPREPEHPDAPPAAPAPAPAPAPADDAGQAAARYSVAVNIVRNKCAQCHQAGREGKGGGFIMLDTSGSRLANLEPQQVDRLNHHVQEETMPPKRSGLPSLPAGEKAALLAYYRLRRVTL